MFQQESPYLPLLKFLVLAGLFWLIMTYNPWGVGPFLFLLVGLIFLAFLLLAGQYLRLFIKNRRSPRLTVPAQVTRKWTREYDIDLPTRRPSSLGFLLNFFFSPTMTVYEQWVYWMTFRVRGKELEFSVPERDYLDRVEGEIGMLTYQGDKFFHFRPLPEAPEAINPPASR